MANGKMYRYSTVIVDDFYDDPDEIREYALGLEYFTSPTGAWPGKRTKPIYEIDSIKEQFFNNRFMSLWYDFENCDAQWVIMSQFHLVDPAHDNKDDILNAGWIHLDTQPIAAAVLYLTPNADPSSGTSLYIPKEGIDVNVDVNERREFYKTGIVSDNYRQTLDEHNSNFIETVSVKNIYNRIVGYDANVFHAAKHHHAGNEPRLTQVFFLMDIKATSDLPIMRIKR